MTCSRSSRSGGRCSAPAIGCAGLAFAPLPGDDLAEHLGVPWAVVAAIPIVRARYRPLVGFPRGPNWLSGYNRIT
ncbi:MAG TPA: hypothetical protein PKD53_00705 [Chloroflexaceae bacterium]|nr:hypothetical protein [Chloroflexaceae bacterium]